MRGAPSFADVWRGVCRRFPGELLVAHNASFDLGVLRAELDRAGMTPTIPHRARCSAALARLAWPALPDVRLASLAERVSIPLEHHEPGSDARASAAVTLLAADTLGIPHVSLLPDVWQMRRASAA